MEGDVFASDRYASIRRTLFGYGIFILAYVIFSVLCPVLCEFYFPALTKSDLYPWLLSVVPIYGFSMPILLFLLRGTDVRTPPKHALPILQIPAFATVCFALMIAGSTVATYVNGLLSEVPFFRTESVGDVMAGQNLLWVFIFTVLVAPTMEELVFRKIFIDRLSPAGDGARILLSGIFFGLFHGNFDQFFYAALLGILFAFIYVRTGHVVYTMILHMFVNFFGGFLPCLLEGDLVRYAESGGDVLSDPEVFRSFLRVVDFVVCEYALAIVGAIVLCLVAGEAIRSFRRGNGSVPDSPIPIRHDTAAVVFRSAGFWIFVGVSALLFFLNLIDPEALLAAVG